MREVLRLVPRFGSRAVGAPRDGLAMIGCFLAMGSRVARQRKRREAEAALEHYPAPRTFMAMKSVVLFAVAGFALAISASAGPAQAAQSLIATPYPGAVGGNAQVLDPEPQGLGGPQTLKDDPYPRIMGENAQGNPRIIRMRHRTQHLIPSARRRRYHVDHD